PRQQQQAQQQPRQQVSSHRRTESYSADSSRNNLPVPSSIPPPLVSPPVQSPRERSRIRTNPWLSANSSGSSTNGLKSRHARDESSSSSGLKLTESSGSASDVNLNLNNGRESQGRREHRQESLSAGRSPINQNWRITSSMDLRPKIPLSLQRRASSSSSSASSVTRSARSSEDDITLNEMMGKFDESYVYEKETDILSDSDPTDCEDYIDSLSDIDTGQDGGDENDPFENDELDYIDNGSFLDLDNLECGGAGHFPNTGHCTYFAFTSELNRRGTRLRESILKRRNKDEIGSQRNANARASAKRQSARHKKTDDKQSEKRKKRISQRRKPALDRCDDETANLNRVLVERMLLKNSGFNQGSRSVGGTPMCLRRRKHDVNKNLSPMRLNDNSSVVRPSVIENEIVKRRSNSVSYVNGNIVRRHVAGNTYMTTFASEIALIEADKEADRKYRELILEAENILVSMQKHQNPSSLCIPSPSRKLHNGLANKRVELIKNTELNIELALSKSRNSQPELQSGSIRDLEHTSPKRQFAQPCSPIHRFMERNSPVGTFAPKEPSPPAFRQHELSKCPDSPAMLRRTTPQSSPSRSLMHHQMHRARNGGDPEPKECGNRSPRVALNCNGGPRLDAVDMRNSHGNKTHVNAMSSSLVGGRKEFRAARESTKEEGVTSSSSDSEEKCDVRRRAPLMTFREMPCRSIDMGPIKEGSSYCPQSEPVKRKVYAGSATYGRIQKTLGEHIMLRNSDGDTATDDTDDSRRSLKEKMAQLRQERLAAEANANNVQDTQFFQHQLSQLRRQMLMQTIEGLKRSLEDQSATLKQTCLEPTSLLTDELP
ncbi:unnamed protein product, partial [Lasius platythorax]